MRLHLGLLPLFLAITLPACATDTQDEGVNFGAGSDAELNQAEDLAYDHLLDDTSGPLVGREIDAFRTLKVNVDETGMAHVKVQQLLGTVPVWGGEAIVHLATDGAIAGMTDSLLEDVDVDTTPAFTADEAIDFAVEEIRNGWADVSDDPVADLWILRQDGVDHLVWRVQLQQINFRADDAMPVVFIDAHTGDFVWSYNNFQTTACSGTTNFYGSVAVECYTDGASYYLEDATDRLATFTYNHTTTVRSNVTSTSTVFPSTSAVTKNAVEAHYAGNAVHDYYSTVFGRNGIDGSGGPGTTTSHGTSFITSASSYSTNYVNAFWDSTYLRMVYGDGDGVSSGSLTTLDIAGHEMTHGVTQYEANLTYSGESGGLNESMSDVLGSMVERSVLGETANTWLIGEDTWTPSTSGDALRYMDDPTRDNVSYGYYFTGVGSADVHYSSGVANHAFYLLSEGGSSTTAVTAIGADDAAAIWYLALSSYMTSSTNYASARTATLAAASALYGSTSTQYTAVGAAWEAVFVNPSISTYRDTITRVGRGSYAPSSSGVSVAAGTQTFGLQGPSSADFDLYLQKKSGKSTWTDVASSTGTERVKTLSYVGTAGTYRTYVLAASGTGAYTLGWKR